MEFRRRMLEVIRKIDGKEEVMAFIRDLSAEDTVRGDPLEDILFLVVIRRYFLFHWFGR